MKRWLLIDDNKRWQDVLKISMMFGESLASIHPGVEFYQAKTYRDGIKLLAEGNWDKVYLDQQLDDVDPKGLNGYDILDAIKYKRVPLPVEMEPCTGHAGHWPVMNKMMEQLYGRGEPGPIERYK